MFKLSRLCICGSVCLLSQNIYLMSLLSHVRYRTKASFISFSSFLLSFVSLSLIHLYLFLEELLFFKCNCIPQHQCLEALQSFCFNKSKDYLRSKQKEGIKIAKQIDHSCYSKLNVTECLIIVIFIET